MVRRVPPCNPSTSSSFQSALHLFHGSHRECPGGISSSSWNRTRAFCRHSGRSRKRALNYSNAFPASNAPSDLYCDLRCSAKPQDGRVLLLSINCIISPFSMHLKSFFSQRAVRGLRRNMARPLPVSLLLPAHRLRKPPPLPRLSAIACALNDECRPQLPPEIEYKDTGYVARAVVFALMCFGCFISLLLWIGEVSNAHATLCFCSFLQTNGCCSGLRTKCCANPSERRPPVIPRHPQPTLLALTPRVSCSDCTMRSRLSGLRASGPRMHQVLPALMRRSKLCMYKMEMKHMRSTRHRTRSL
jgi:hypothetical protein